MIDNTSFYKRPSSPSLKQIKMLELVYVFSPLAIFPSSASTFLSPTYVCRKGLDATWPAYVQVPNAFWHPVPQYAVVEPHHPAELQQFPNVEPWHVKPAVPPQVASVVTFFVAVGAAEVEVLVEETTTVVEERTELLLGRTELLLDRTELLLDRTVELTADELTPVHVPNADWQPVAQYAVVDPHHPAELQQFPKVLPWQVLFAVSVQSCRFRTYRWTYFPVVPPQVPSVETFLVEVAVAAVEVRVVVTTVETRVDVETTEEETEPPVEERYQLAAGSPRHSPTVTAL